MAGTDEDTVLSLDDVKVHYDRNEGLFNFFGDDEYVHAVDGISLDIAENEVIALVGESGCGKTTLGKTAIGLVEPTSGSVSYRGQDIWDAKNRRGEITVPYHEIRKSLQIIHQDPASALNPNQTILKSLSLPLKKWQSDLSRLDRYDRIHRTLETVGLRPAESYAKRYPHQLSGGEKQRVALVRALLMSPDVILADEAVSALDVSLRIEMMDLLHDIQEDYETSFLFISHDLANAWYLAGKVDGYIGVMYLGELVEFGPADDVIENPEHPYTQTLKWATPELGPTSDEELPLRKIDVANPRDPPAGCRFHTRCPEAREHCRSEAPEEYTPEDGAEEHFANCYRLASESNPYWGSPELTDEDTEPIEAAE